MCRRPSPTRASPSPVRPLALDAFMQVTIGSAYFPKVTDQLRYYTTDKVLFRFVRQPCVKSGGRRGADGIG